MLWRLACPPKLWVVGETKEEASALHALHALGITNLQILGSGQHYQVANRNIGWPGQNKQHRLGYVC